jgi:hypothetical protein
LNTVLAKVFIIENLNEYNNKNGEIMSKIWDILQVFFGLLLVWVLVAIEVSVLWVSDWLTSVGSPWLAPLTVVGYLVLVLVILQLVKALTRVD